ncbi:KAP P-loop domain protein [Natrinema pellirubrum DSM 15624]|uniref:KAP P-loop domain protein n=1 Tax=Natrinema pellirubrum (strain DSM 15624 / CIP 106293 / JCM 10476 / NCIMB 786 / 157) TaxID=797303 RepID=L0JTE2_NATP1|nr:P-loop NTPase fold protein [Natrinema pellirubrum]AGB34078.1 KAP family P-loop domain protein [Natrinema pellirubrum DSM 15624]ELY72155.1 KAP P-loop domain protein [Natrinema pellirubrum DSM 15624]
MDGEEDRNRYLSDSPIENVDEDEFRHQEYVDTLERMVEDADPPWNIGVFGEWGSGKTSIIRMLYSRLQDAETDYVCVEFDAWKHAEESIRTDLLLNLDQAIGNRTGQTDEEGNDAVLGEDKITQKLYDIEEEQRGEDLSAWEEAERIITESPLIGGTTLLILGIIIVGAVVNLLNIVGLVEIADPTISSINSILSAFLFPLFVSVFVFMAGEVRQATTALRQKHPRKEWSGAYEQLFDDILEETDADKVLISIDNLDRCESDTVYDVLVSLKTFLQSKDCIYIVPCDDQALQSHIESIDTEGDYFEVQLNEREFLRKFFQTHIRIPDFMDEDIEEYAKSQNRELAEPFDDAVLDVITKAYVRNPRRINQSLNRLTTLRILSEQMEEANHLTKGRLTDNLDFLAKIMVLEEDYPSFHRELQDDPRLLEDVNDYFRGDLPNGDRKDRIEKLLGNGEEGMESETELERFLRSTLRCTVDNPKPFLQLGEPSFASALSDRDALIQNLRTNQEDEVREELQTVKMDNQPFTPYLDAIETTLDDYTREGREGPIFSTINTLVAVFDELGEEGQENVAGVLGAYLVLDQVRDFYTDFDPEEFFPVVLHIPDPDQKMVFERFAATVATNSKLRENVLEVFVENAEDVPRTAARSLCSSLLNLSDNELEGALDTLSRGEESKKLATPKLLERAATFVTWDGRRNRFNGTDHYKQFDSQAQPRGRQYFVEELLNLEGDVDNENEDQYYNQLRQKLSQLEGQVTLATGSRLFRELEQRVSSSGQDVNMVKVAINFYESYDAGTREDFGDLVADLLSRWNQRNTQQIINHASNQEVDILDDKQAVGSVLDRVPEPLSNANWVAETLIPAIPEEYDDQLFEMVKRLTEDNDHTQNLIAAQIFSEYPDRFEEVQDPVLECCQRRISSANTNQTKTYLRAEAAAYNRLEDPDKEGFIKRLDSLLSGDQNDHQAFEDIWNQIEGEIEPDRKMTVARNLRSQLRSELSGNPQHNRLFPLVDVLSSLVQTGDVDEDDGEWVVERLSDTFEGSNLHNNHVSTLIDKLAEFPEYYGREEQTLTRLESLIGNNNNNRIHQSAKNLIDALEKTGEVDGNRLEEARERLRS